MSFKLALLFVVCFLALAGAIPVEKTEDQDTKQPQPVAEDPEKEATEEDPVPEDNEDADDGKDDGEDQSQEDTNDEEKEDEEEPETDDSEEEPENEVEAKEEDEDEVKRTRPRRYHPQCRYVTKRVRRCRYKLRCTGNYYRGRGRCCRKYRHCAFYVHRKRICQICRRRCRLVCSYRYRVACQPHMVCSWRRRRVGRHYRRYRYCHYVRRCRRIRYRFCQHRCYGYRCYWPRYRG